MTKVSRWARIVGVLTGGLTLVLALAGTSSAARHAQRPNLAVHLAATPRPAQVGQNLTYSLTVRNFGADTSNVRLQNVIPARSTFVSASASQGSCTGARPLVCSLGSLAHGATATVTVVVKPTAAGVLIDSASVHSDRRDHRPWNNHAVVAVRVGPLANLGVGMSASPRPGHVGADLTYTIRVRNLGSADATNVQLTARVPARSTLVSATPSQGSCTGSAPIVCSLGTLAKGATATVTVVVNPTATGWLVASAHAHAAERDLSPWNNGRRVLTHVVS